jgi:hypothetical protein
MNKTLNFIFIIFILTSCSSTNLSISERKEGFSKSILRVFIRNQIPEEVDFIRAAKEFPELSKQVADKRAVLLIFSKIYTDTPNFTSFDDLQNEVKSALDSGKRIQAECNEYYCEAFFDYDISALNSKLDKIWKPAN